MLAAIGTAEIYYEKIGDGPPLLLLHGNGESHEVFHPILPRLAERFTVIAMDSRGHGQSSHGEGELSLLKMANDAAGLLTSLSIESAHVLGFSDGGNIAMLLAVYAPEKVRSLVLTGANAYPSGMRMKYYLPICLSQIGSTLGTVVSPKAARKKEFLDLMIKEPNLRRADLERISVPTLLTAGEDDMISRRHTLWLQSCIPGSELHWFPGDHFTPAKRPDEYFSVIEQFLERQI